MSDFYDTRDGEYENRDAEPPRVRKRKYLSWLPWLMPVAAIVAVGLVLAMAVTAKAKRERIYNTGTLSAKYIGDLKPVPGKEGVLVPPRPTNRVIFRSDGVEIFRFTYEGGRDGEKLSFEVVEGSQ